MRARVGLGVARRVGGRGVLHPAVLNRGHECGVQRVVGVAWGPQCGEAVVFDAANVGRGLLAVDARARGAMLLAAAGLAGLAPVEHAAKEGTTLGGAVASTCGAAFIERGQVVFHSVVVRRVIINIGHAARIGVAVQVEESRDKGLEKVLDLELVRGAATVDVLQVDEEYACGVEDNVHIIDDILQLVRRADDAFDGALALLLFELAKDFGMQSFGLELLLVVILEGETLVIEALPELLARLLAPHVFPFALHESQHMIHNGLMESHDLPDKLSTPLASA